MNKYNNIDTYSESEFLNAYRQIYIMLTKNKNQYAEKNAILLGGQPGSGKSFFYQNNKELKDYIIINGDEFRKMHPRYDFFKNGDADDFATRTQSFCNEIVEKLIDDLSNNGYNMVIEGTFRNPEVAIGTSKLLDAKSYNTKGILVATDAEKSWRSTILRAQIMKENGLPVRLVPVDKFKATIENLPNSVDNIINRSEIKEFNIIDREGNTLYNRNETDISPGKIVESYLEYDKWNDNYKFHEQEYIMEKIKLLVDVLEKDDDIERAL